MKRIGIDIDGVIAGGDYTPPENRTLSHYLTLPVIDGAVNAIAELTLKHKVWLISKRQYDAGCTAWSMTLAWLIDKKFPVKELSGLITTANEKRPICEALNLDYMFDDSPDHIKEFDGSKVKGILVRNYVWSENLDMWIKRNYLKRVGSIREIPDFLKYHCS